MNFRGQAGDFSAQPEYFVPLLSQPHTQRLTDITASNNEYSGHWPKDAKTRAFAPPYTDPMAPRIGISLCLDDRARWRPGRDYLYLDHAYPQALVAAGGQPILLPVGSDPHAQAADLDGLLLPGGDDFLPEPPHPYSEDVSFDPISPRQLEFDKALLVTALERRIPILGICYGAQLMALQHGGELHYDLPSDLPESGDHQLPEDGGRHPVDVDMRSQLGHILRRSEIEVNSLHHQAIAEVGHGLRVCARAPDGVIEAVESENEPFQMGVQWHPEKLGETAGAALFRALVSACESG